MNKLQEKLCDEAVERFGRVELKTDCEHCMGDKCRILKKSYCRFQICYFYKKKSDLR
jgi:hypothetical protein